MNRRKHDWRPRIGTVPAASRRASSRACVSGSTVLRSTPSVALDKSNSDAVFMMGLSRSSWSKMNDSTFGREHINFKSIKQILTDDSDHDNINVG